MFRDLPSLNAILVLEAAARLGSFKEAARELHVTPTAVSHQIRGLEAVLAVPLFTRSTRKVSLTPEGQRLADAARRGLREIATAVEAIGARRAVLTVSTTAAFAAMWLVPRLHRFASAQPEIDVRVRTTEAIEDLERSPGVDVALRYGQGAPEARWRVEETFGVYANPAFVAADDPLEALVGRVAFVETRWKNERLPPLGWRQWWARFGEGEPPKVEAYDQEHHALHAAMARPALLLASDRLVEAACAHGWLRSFRAEHRLPGLGYGFVTASGRAGEAKVRAFEAWLRAELRL